MVSCDECGKNMRADNMPRHKKTKHPAYLTCSKCCAAVLRQDMDNHRILCNDNVDFRLCGKRSDHTDHLPECAATSVKGFFRSWKLQVEDDGTYDNMLSQVCSSASDVIIPLINSNPVKCQVVIEVRFDHDEIEGTKFAEQYFRTMCEPLLISDDVQLYLARVKAQLRLAIEKFETRGSGWVYNGLISAHLDAAKFKPLTAGANIEIPKKIKDMHSTLNIHSTDQRCFLYCLLAKKCMVDDHTAMIQAETAGLPEPAKKLPPSGRLRQESSSYLPYEGELDMTGITYPIKLKDIRKVEAMNNLSISVFEWNFEEKCVIPLKHGCRNGTNVELLYLENEEASHFVLIKCFNQFMRHRTKHHNSKYHCMRCLYGYLTAEKLQEHAVHCNQKVLQVSRMPKPGVIKFKGHDKKIKRLFTIYGDTESTLEPVEEVVDDASKSYTTLKQKHRPCSFALVTASEFEDYVPETVVRSNKDPAKLSKEFINEMNRLHEDMMFCYNAYSYDIDMTPKTEKAFKKARSCHICNRFINKKSGNYAVRDHNHFKQKDNFRGAAHLVCNLNYWQRMKQATVIFHCAQYDANLFILDLIKDTDEKHLKIIPQNLEKFKSFQTREFIFIDSFQFLTTSLATLVDNLRADGPHNFKMLKQVFPGTYLEDGKHRPKCELLMEKGVYCYDYCSSFDVFSETCLPPIEAFYNKMTEEHLSEEDYARAVKTFDIMECKTLHDYMALYVLTDTLLLCDVFESFRDLCLEYYKLDPCHYVSLPGFGLDAMLLMTQVSIELITDHDMYRFMFDNLRGGITTINQRRAKANNPYLTDYEEGKPTSYILYLDINNLYAIGLQGNLPIKDFKWLTEEEITCLDIMSMDPDGDTWYALEVDLEYPPELHDLHNDYPMAVEKKCIDTNDLSPYNQKFLKDLGEKHNVCEKLVPDLKAKHNYVCSLKNLQFFIKHGLKLKKVHKVMSAKQEPWMASFIQFNTDRRTEATTPQKKDLFKLMNNCTYGKLIEDIFKYRSVVAVKSVEKAQRMTSKPQVSEFHILDDEVTLIQSVPRVANMNKPIACGFQVLEAAKNHMLYWWYDVLKAKYGSNVTLILSDTDSLMFHVYTEDVYRDLESIKHLMDMSPYSLRSGLYDATNKKVIGKMSDEKPDQVISEVVALKSKMYTVKAQGHYDTPWVGDIMNTSKTAKGVPKTAKKKITFEDYSNILKTASVNTVTFRSIRGVRRQNQTLELKKRGLSAFDDKKYILEDGEHTLSYGHFRIPPPDTDQV